MKNKAKLRFCLMIYQPLWMIECQYQFLFGSRREMNKFRFKVQWCVILGHFAYWYEKLFIEELLIFFFFFYKTVPRSTHHIIFISPRIIWGKELSLFTNVLIFVVIVRMFWSLCSPTLFRCLLIVIIFKEVSTQPISWC